MTETATVITVDQVVGRPPEQVRRALTEPDLLARWWTPGDVAPVVGHTVTLEMPGWGSQPCEVLEVDAPRRFVHRFTERWTLTWTLVAEGSGTRLLLEHSGFDPDHPQDRHALVQMGPGWRDHVLPRLARTVESGVCAS